MLLHQAGGGWSTCSSLPWPSVISQENGRKGSVLGRQNLESRSVGPQPEHPPPPAGELFCKGRGEAQAPPPHAHCAGQLALLPLRRGRLLPGCPEVLRGASLMRCEVRSFEIVVRSTPCVVEGWREGGTGRGIQDGDRGTLREASGIT